MSPRVVYSDGYAVLGLAAGLPCATYMFASLATCIGLTSLEDPVSKPMAKYPRDWLLPLQR